MKYVQVTPNLYLVKSTLALASTSKKAKEPLNHLIIYDRSGSMYSLLSRLVEDLIDRVKWIPVGDTVTIGWFSSEGERNFILKGFKVTEDRDYTLLEKALRANNTIIGCTCFSEILHDTDQVIKDLSIFSSLFSLTFLTDGYPVVSNYNREIKEIYSAVEKLNGKVASALLVGYGDYYNKELMSQMAAKIGGYLTHSSNLQSFSLSFGDFLAGTQDSKKVTVKIDTPLSDDAIVFNINGTSINLYEVSGGEVKVSVSEDESPEFYILTSLLPKCVESTDVNEFERALYASSYILTQRTKTDKAIDVLGFLGDKKLIDMVTNSYTNAEYGVSEGNIKEAVFEPALRYLDGRVANYVPPTDAFCLLDLIDLLSEDQEAFFYPRNKAFSYKRIGKPSVVDDKYPKFNADEKTKCSFSGIIWNEKKVNLSLLANIKGTIKLPTEAKKYGLALTFPTFEWKTYTFVKDGVLNVTEVPVSVSKETFKELVIKGVIPFGEKWKKNQVFTLRLDSIPIVNRKIAEANTSATSLCKLVIEEQFLKATLKVIKWYKERDFPEKEISVEAATTFAEKQQAFLDSVGINTKTGAFAPKLVPQDATDFYMAKEFAISVKGLSSLPKVEVVAGKLADNKKLTVSDALMSTGVNLCEAQKALPQADKLAWYMKTIEDNKVILKKVRRQIQETKFAILLGKKWFNEFSSREENTLTFGGYEFTISLEEKKVAI